MSQSVPLPVDTGEVDKKADPDTVDADVEQPLDPQAILNRKLGRKAATQSSESLLSESKGPSSAGPLSHAGKKSILLVEDVRVSQRVARLSLQRAKFKVDTVSSAKDAIAKFSKTTYETVLMDINLGINKPDGCECAKQMRAFEKEHNLPRTTIFGLTGSVSATDIERYKEADMDGVIAKGNVLVQAINEAREAHAKTPDEFIIARLEVKK